MKNNEKIKIIDSMEKIDVLENKHFGILKKFSYDKDAFVRSRCAALLINFKTDESLKLLLRLSNDKNSFVRTEAYDSLGVFYFTKVEETLFKAISFEKNGLAKQYAILSWADVSSKLHNKFKDYILFILNEIDNYHTEEYNSCQIRLSYYYALQVFGYDVICNMISFLNNDNYLIRCRALNLLNDIADKNNKKIIETSIINLLKTEETIAVKCEAKRVLNELKEYF